MKAVVLEVDEKLLAERRRMGLDLFDEMWEGVLHMVPPPGGDHQAMAAALFRVLDRLAERRGLVGRFETGLFRPGASDDFRVPDQIYCRPELLTGRGIDGPADFVVEIRSPGDESVEKLPFYDDLGVTEILLVDPRSGAFDLYRPAGSAQALRIPVEDRGEVRCEVLDCTFSTRGQSFVVGWHGGEAEISGAIHQGR
ncbi:hypothetical protein BH24ACT3_BH24ACT3_01160 [soil metagenome]